MHKNTVESPGYGHHHTAYFIITSIAFCHFLNDMMSSSLLPSVFPMFKALLHLRVGRQRLRHRIRARQLLRRRHAGHEEQAKEDDCALLHNPDY